MKTDFIFIDEALNNKKTFLCFLIILLGIIISCYSASETYNNFFVNVYNIFTNLFFIFCILVAFIINNLNIISNITSKYTFILRTPEKKKNNFFKKELILANLYLVLLSLILVISFSILHCNGSYIVLEKWKLDILFIIIFIFVSILLGLFMLKLSKSIRR